MWFIALSGLIPLYIWCFICSSCTLSTFLWLDKTYLTVSISCSEEPLSDLESCHQLQDFILWCSEGTFLFVGLACCRDDLIRQECFQSLEAELSDMQDSTITLWRILSPFHPNNCDDILLRCIRCCSLSSLSTSIRLKTSEPLSLMATWALTVFPTSWSASPLLRDLASISSV